MIDFAEFKKFFLFNLIGSLIITAAVAVITVLVGEFNEVTTKVLFTLLMVVVHSIISLSFIWDDERQNTFERLAFFINIFFVLIVISFVTSLFGIWKIVDGKTILHLYMTYFTIGFAALHADILSKALHKEKYMDYIIFGNYISMIIVVAMLQPMIYMNMPSDLGEYYFRTLGAVGIIDGTLSILTIIFYKLYMNKHPKTDNPLMNGTPKGKSEKKGFSPWVWILMGFLLIQMVSLALRMFT